MQHRQLVHKFVLSQSLLLQVPHVGQLLHHLLHPVRPHSLHTGQINRSHIPHQVQLPQDQPKVRVCAVLSISVAGLGRRRGNRTERAGGGGGGGGLAVLWIEIFFWPNDIKMFPTMAKVLDLCFDRLDPNPVCFEFLD